MKLTQKSNFRVEIIPTGQEGMFITRTPERIESLYKEVCKKIVEQVKRHVDNVGSVGMAWDTTHICSHCGWEWEIDESGVPTCCQEAIDEHEASKIAAK